MPVELHVATCSQRVMPFAEKEYIDLDRTRRILGISYWTAVRMAHSGLIDWMDHGKATHKRIRYQSVWEYCERLRIQHRIPDRRPALAAPYLRYLDEDLLPFRLRDTLPASLTLQALGYSPEGVQNMVKFIEEGRFEAYQLVPQGRWRISRPSLLVYLESLPRPRASHVTRYKVSGISNHF